MLKLYQTGIRLYYLFLVIASLFSRRARQFLSGRRLNRQLLEGWARDPAVRTVWMHVSSLGEFEQGRPVLEQWKARYPYDRILLSFFSPSGFNVRRNYPLADRVFYLPLDTRKNMEKLVGQLQPDLFILVKYDLWPNLLAVMEKKRIRSYLISATFRPGQYLFRKWGSPFLDQLRVFKRIFVQDAESAKILRKFGFTQITVAGDTRVDAVMNREVHVDLGERGDAGWKVMIGGSTWPAEEKLFERLWKSEDFAEFRKEWRLIVAPHDISESHLREIEGRFPGETIRFSRLPGTVHDAFLEHPVILVDTIGHLFRLYGVADLAFIGGGFGKGIHNILEPAAHGIPVLFGPNHLKFREADSLIRVGAAFSINGFPDFRERILGLCSDPVFRTGSGQLALSYMKNQTGSTGLIIRHLLGKS